MIDRCAQGAAQKFTGSIVGKTGLAPINSHPGFPIKRRTLRPAKSC